MTLSLGIDTGGTFTDAVLVDDASGTLLAKAKARTTPDDLAVGIGAAIHAVVERAGVESSTIGLVSLSTTLATNAVVENRGGRVALVFIGFDEGDEQRGGLAEALRGEPLIRVAGGHSPHGDPLAALDASTLEAEAVRVAPDVTGFAITAKFATRNNEHERQARDIVAAATGLPVTCSHELSAQLNGPKRALTSVLNARLIGVITELIGSAESILAELGIVAPLMVVRGDGSLITAAMAMGRPIETILSGPAASVVGAAHLTHHRDAIIADIGGTTTDVAVIADGAPELDPNGAVVGGWRTMVEAVAMTTIGLGGDSEVTVDPNRTAADAIVIGPRRVTPLSVAALDHPDVAVQLRRQLVHEPPSDLDGRFAVRSGLSRRAAPSAANAATAGLDERTRALLERIDARPIALSTAVQSSTDRVRLARLVERGLIQLIGFTPTDAAHVSGAFVDGDVDAARLGADVLARQRTSAGTAVCADGGALSDRVLGALRRQSAELLFDVGLGLDGYAADRHASAGLSRHPLIAGALDGRRGVTELRARLTTPVIGLGASAALHYPAIAALLHADVEVPADADVANALGAVVGQVRIHVDVTVAQIRRGKFRIHHPRAAAEGGRDHGAQDTALALAERLAEADARVGAIEAGVDVDHVHVQIRTALNIAHLDGVEMFVDGVVSAIASGRAGVTR